MLRRELEHVENVFEDWLWTQNSKTSLKIDEKKGWIVSLKSELLGKKSQDSEKQDRIMWINKQKILKPEFLN